MTAIGGWGAGGSLLCGTFQIITEVEGIEKEVESRFDWVENHDGQAFHEIRESD